VALDGGARAIHPSAWNKYSRKFGGSLVFCCVCFIAHIHSLHTRVRYLRYATFFGCVTKVIRDKVEAKNPALWKTGTQRG
jgi:hypothetical protein